MKIILTILVLITSFSTVYAQKKGKENLDSLMKELPKAKEDTSKVKLLLRIARAHRNTDSKTALIYAKKSEAMATKLNFKEGLSKSRYFIGNVYLEISDYHNALKYYNKSLEFERAYGDNEAIASVLHNIANAYLSLGNYPKGIEVNLKALKLFEKAGSKNGTANCHNNIGIIYNDIGDEKNSVYHFRKALKLYTEIDFKPGIAVSLNNMANYYMSRNDLLKSKEVITKALVIYEELDNAEGKDLALINLSQNSLLGRDYDNALIFGFRALQIAKAFDMPEAIAYDYESISAIYYEMAMDENLKSAKANAFVSKNFALKLAEAYVDSSIAIFSKLEMLTEYSKAAELKAKISFASGDYKQAFENYKLFKILNDSIFNIEKDKKITQSAMQYDFDKKEAKIIAENEKQNIRQRNIRNSITGGLVGTLIFSVVVYRQRNKISKTKKIIEEKNGEILSSIKYALRIQNAILPPPKIVKQHLENSFILYKPKDIVAGDFYWLESIGDLVLFAACDCTGHGVPGAMVSVVCHNALNRAVREFRLTRPAAILDKTTQIVLENFSKSEDEIHDGMDISICSFNTKTKTLEWAGANNSLILINNGQLTETKADKQCIGYNDNIKPFTNHQFNLPQDTNIYLFTDGFADQFGGERERKLTKSKFKELLLLIQNLPIQQQAKELDDFITNYKRTTEQTDDILVIGVRV